ncbi:8759_t:CDS:1 [Gigaspora margarita]|uniref:8759_t:CDS:1 n=1 Tax=Gigaspora margarita TaxID=4874 RepID=A0ABN7W1D5_GIGMA|nr:8759_t:CDS:1 [Gigaspora margarita]
MHKSPLDNPSSASSASGQERQRRPIISGPQTNVQPVGMQQTNVPIQAIGHGMVYNTHVPSPNIPSRMTQMTRHSSSPLMKHTQQPQAIMPNSGNMTMQNVSSHPISLSSRGPQSGQPGGVMQQSATAPQVVPLMNPPIYALEHNTVTYRNLSPTLVARPPIGMNINTQQQNFESNTNAPSIQHNFNTPLLHNPQQNALMLPSARITTSTVPTDLPSNPNRQARPLQMTLPISMQDTGPQQRQPVLSTTVPSGSTPQTTIPHLSMQRERSHQGAPSKPISHALILPAEPPRNINETNPTHVQTSPLSQAPSHLSNRNNSRPAVSDNHSILQPVHQQTPTHRSATMSPTMQHVSSHSSQQRNTQKANAQTVSQNSVKTTSAVSKTTSRTSHNKQSHKTSMKYTQQEASYQENVEAAQAADAARVLVMSSRQRTDSQRSMNSEHNVPNISRFSELSLGTSSINNGGVESSPRSNRYTGSVIMDYSISTSINDDYITKDQEIGLTPHNRGHKMKNRAAALDSGVKLRAPYGYQEDLEYIDIPSGSRRPIIYRISSADAEQVTEFNGDLLDSPYKDINVKEILDPLRKPEDAVLKLHYKHVFKSNHLNSLARVLCEKIEKEKIFNMKLSRLMYVLQGDDVMHQDLDFRLNPPPETVSTRGVKAEEVEGGLGFGVLNVGLQGSERSRGRLSQESKDPGLEVMIQARNELTSLLVISNEILRRYQETWEGLRKAIRRRDEVYCKLREIDALRQKEGQ